MFHDEDRQYAFRPGQEWQAWIDPDDLSSAWCLGRETQVIRFEDQEGAF